MIRPQQLKQYSDIDLKLAIEKLPMFCASRYITYNRAWTERARIMKSADGADKFNKVSQASQRIRQDTRL